ncbi:MAG: HAD family phosphatase [Lachnospiraceae bacterium]|nr:HAD family phosphatase [Lachnospiraceae bacterium]
MIKNVVLDISNVLVDYDPVEYLVGKGIDVPTIKRIVKASVLSPYWEAFERSDLTEEEAMKAFVSLDPEIEDALYKAYADISGMLSMRSYAVNWVKELKSEGYNVYYLSNYSKKAYDECPESLEFIKYTDGGLLSYAERLTKPDPKFYRRLIDRYGIIPNESLFIDDSEENVEVAKRLGFKGHLFKSYEEAKEFIKKEK